MQGMRVKLALSTLCESPDRKTGLSTFFPEFVAAARRAFPEVSWLVFAGESAPWADGDPDVEVCRTFPSNERTLARLAADHLRVAPEARRRGARALFTVGFHPLRDGGLPVGMQVVALAGSLPGGGLRQAYRRWGLSRGLSRSAVVFTNSAWSRSQVGNARAPVIVSPEGVRHDLFTPHGARGVEGCGDRYLAWASNFYDYKRAELALEAYAGLPGAVRGSMPFVLCGGDWNGGRLRAERAAARLGISGQVRFLGWLPDERLPAFLRGAYAHVLSTECETFGRSVLDAMACGCPSVVQDLPVLREVAGESAVFTDFSSRSAATEALARLCADEAGRDRLGAAAAARALLFSYDRLARERVGAVLRAIGAAPP